METPLVTSEKARKKLFKKAYNGGTAEKVGIVQKTYGKMNMGMELCM